MPEPLTALRKAETISEGPSVGQERAQAAFENLMEALGGATGLWGNDQSAAHAAGEVGSLLGPAALKSIAVPTGLMRILKATNGSTEALEGMNISSRMAGRVREAGKLLESGEEAAAPILQGSMHKPGTPGWSNDRAVLRAQSPGVTGRSTNVRQVAQISQEGPVFIHPDQPFNEKNPFRQGAFNRNVNNFNTRAAREGRPERILRESSKEATQWRTLRGKEAEPYRPFVQSGINDQVKISETANPAGRGAPTKVTTDQVLKIRELGNGKYANLNPAAAAQAVIKELGLSNKVGSVAEILRGDTMARVGGKTRNRM